MVPSLSIADSSISVHGAGDVAMPFTITMNQAAPSGGTSVHVATTDGTATAGVEYAALDTTLTIAAGETQANFNVVVHGRTTPGDDKSFSVTLSDPGDGVALGNATATGTIHYDIPVQAEIWQINGSGQQAALLGKSVLTYSNVVTAVGPLGFTMQTPDARADASPLTSNGVYVFTGSTPTVSVGEAVDVAARVDD
ncbi:LTD domain-containing protein OS=Rhodanobacter lindaniclasticus OX=75310 GN=B1991_03705 PE=4 SV=1 [Rhodanobacter lindaniclasticus]